MRVVRWVPIALASRSRAAMTQAAATATASSTATTADASADSAHGHQRVGGTCVLKSLGAAFCAGDNSSGDLGNGSTVNSFLWFRFRARPYLRRSPRILLYGLNTTPAPIAGALVSAASSETAAAATAPCRCPSAEAGASSALSLEGNTHAPVRRSERRTAGARISLANLAQVIRHEVGCRLRFPVT
jgi:hypothetical protein